MRCIKCNEDNTFSDRKTYSGQCKKCRHPFVFEPQKMSKGRFTDRFFANTIALISVERTFFFTSKQLLYLLDKRLKSKSIPVLFSWFLILYFMLHIFVNIILEDVVLLNQDLSFFLPDEVFIILTNVLIEIGFIVCLFLFSGSTQSTYRKRQLTARMLNLLGGWILVFGSVVSSGLLNSIFLHREIDLKYFNSLGLFATTTTLGILSISLGIIQLKRAGKIPHSFLISYKQAQDGLNRWIQINGSIEKLLLSPHEAGKLTSISAEMNHYSFDRAIVCESAAMAQFLIANNFHVEYNCAILSISGYPQNIFDTVLQMLRRNSALQVYALHDASPYGVALADRLRTSPQWFAGSTATVYDLGLSPGQALKNPQLFRQQSTKFAQQARQLIPAVRQQLSAEELDWLNAGYCVELESFTPRRLLKIVSQGIAWSCRPGNDNGFNIWMAAFNNDDSEWQGMYRASEDSFG